MTIGKVAASVAMTIALTTFAASAFAASPLSYCKADAERLCAGVAPGGGRIAKCLKAHENDISIGCAKELKKLKG